MGTYNRKYAVAALGLLIMPFASFSQDKDFKTYTQQVTGTDLKFDMVAIPGGQFTMGSSGSEPGHKPDEGPQHQVKLDPFWIGRYGFVGRVIASTSSGIGSTLRRAS